MTSAKGVALKRVVQRWSAPGTTHHDYDEYVTREKLACGHVIVVFSEMQPSATRRRCYQCAEAHACPICEGGSGSPCPSHFL
jgi:hypothetical protein